MDAFRTAVIVPEFATRISHEDRILGIGSCFIENIGIHLSNLKYQWLENPFGILYNPASMADGLRRIMSGQKLQDGELFLNQGLWHSRAFHSRYSHPDRERALEQMNASIQQANHFFREATHLLLTFGTSFVYRRLDDEEIVANCHKLPAQQFSKELLELAAMVSDWLALAQEIRQFNPKLEILLSVSPIRHKTDGFVANQRSKARLLLLCEQLSEHLDQVAYFPSYEILMDELRDYRFYADDMIHPGSQAINYIWQRFETALISEESRLLNKQIAQFNKGLSHRPLFPDTPGYQAHLYGLRQKFVQLEARLPMANWSAEKAFLGL